MDVKIDEAGKDHAPSRHRHQPPVLRGLGLHRGATRIAGGNHIGDDAVFADNDKGIAQDRDRVRIRRMDEGAGDSLAVKVVHPGSAEAPRLERVGAPAELAPDFRLVDASNDAVLHQRHAHRRLWSARRRRGSNRPARPLGHRPARQCVVSRSTTITSAAMPGASFPVSGRFIAAAPPGGRHLQDFVRGQELGVVGAWPCGSARRTSSPGTCRARCGSPARRWRGRR